MMFQSCPITRPLPRVDDTTDFAFCFQLEPFNVKPAQDSLPVNEPENIPAVRIQVWEQGPHAQKLVPTPKFTSRWAELCVR